MPWEIFRFRSIVARTNNLSIDRPDIKFCTKELCRAMADPRKKDWSTLKHLGRYLKAHPQVKETVDLTKPVSEEELHVHVDSDFAGCGQSRNSTSGGCVIWNGACLKT